MTKTIDKGALVFTSHGHEYIYGGDSGRSGMRITARIGSGDKHSMLETAVTNVAPVAEAYVPAFPHPWISVYNAKATAPRKSAPWYAAVLLDGLGMESPDSWHKTKRDAVAWARHTLAIATWHEG